MKKEQLQNLKDILCTYYKETPRKLKTSIATVGCIDISTIALAFHSLIEENQDIDIIIKSLIASGITTGILVSLIAYQIEIINENNKKHKKKVLKK